MEKRIYFVLILYLFSVVQCFCQNSTDPKMFFRIKVADEATSRGIPLVKLTTLTNVVHYTDSAGVVAFYEPALMNKEVYFTIESDGYSIEKDPYDGYGKILNVIPGGSAIITMRREIIAQRLYRITGTGIYHDSLLLGDAPPIKAPVINANVCGQDSALCTIYKGRLFWVWGDTGHPRHPLAGNFKSTCGTSLLPADGGLDPDVGIDIEYFRDGDFVRHMVPLPGPGNPYWLGCLLTVKDAAGRERLLAHYAKIKPLMETVGRGIVEFNDEKGIFEELRQYPLDEVIQPNGYPFTYTEGGVEYFYFFADGFYRTPSQYDAVIDHARYEAFTCLSEGERFDGAKSRLDRAPDGALVYSWRKNTSPIGQKEQNQLVGAGLIKPQEKWFGPVDIASGKEILFHGGSIAWNPYRKRWVMIFNEVFGTTLLGEIWYAEGDTPLGPWMFAQKIVTHKKYSFYNVVQHPPLAKENRRKVFFEGTYTTLFSGNENPTPRYDYNQVMYKIDLADMRLILPVPVYWLKNSKHLKHFTGDNIEPLVTERKIVFLAPDRQAQGTVPVYEYYEGNSPRLSTKEPSPPPDEAWHVAFYALPAGSDAASTGTTPLYEFVNNAEGRRYYTINKGEALTGYNLSPTPVCLVWKYPRKFNPYIITPRQERDVRPERQK